MIEVDWKLYYKELIPFKVSLEHYLTLIKNNLMFKKGGTHQ